jgi:hypothetical protein
MSILRDKNNMYIHNTTIYNYTRVMYFGEYFFIRVYI